MRRLAVIKTNDATALVRTVREPARIDVDGARWFAAVVSIGRVLNVADDLAAAGFRSYCPLETRLSTQPKRSPDGKWRKRVRQRPVFGPYLFVGEVNATLYRSTHRDIREILGDRDGPRQINPTFLRRVNDDELAGAWDFRPRRAPRYAEGTPVMVSDGPFRGFLAVVQEACANGGVTVEIDVFGRKAPLVIAETALEPA